MRTTITTSSIEYSIENQIVIASYLPNVHITLEVARQIVEDRLVFTQNQSYPVLINSRGVFKMDKEARDYLSSEKGVRGLKAAAILVGSPFSSFLGNFFVWVNKTTLPVRVFTQYDAALRWLESYR